MSKFAQRNPWPSKPTIRLSKVLERALRHEQYQFALEDQSAEVRTLAHRMIQSLALVIDTEKNESSENVAKATLCAAVLTFMSCSPIHCASDGLEWAARAMAEMAPRAPGLHEHELPTPTEKV